MTASLPVVEFLISDSVQSVFLSVSLSSGPMLAVVAELKSIIEHEIIGVELVNFGILEFSATTLVSSACEPDCVRTPR